MSRMISVVAVALSCASLVGCVMAPFQPPGGLVAVTKAPLSTDGNWKAGLKSGSSTARSCLGLYAWGDCSITAAAKNGGLKRVDYLDYDYLNVIGIWQEVTVTAYGE